MRLSSVDLPQPEWPISETTSPYRDLQIDVLQGDEAPFLVSKLMPTFSTEFLTMAFIYHSPRTNQLAP